MAEINSPNSSSQRKGKAVFSKKSVRVDLTPMVDLGFILVTFFVFTTALSEPFVMDILYPKDSDTTNDKICESCVLTVLPVKENKLWYYEGNEATATYKETNYRELRKLLLDKKKRVLQQRGADQFVLIIRPMQNSQYHNLVDVLDECAISDVARYYIDEPSENEIVRFK